MAHSKGPLLLDGWEKNAAKSGIVYYKLTRMRLQPWSAGSVKQYWCELHRESSFHPRQLVLVEMPRSTQVDAETIPLEAVFKITRREGSVKGKFLFQIMTSNGKFTFGTDSLEATEGWIRALNEELFGPPKHDIIYEYRVKVHKDHKGDISYGNYLLKVYNKEIRLFTSNGIIPTKFKCSMEDIHKVKYNSIRPQDCCVTISVKNTQTKNKEIDILILNTQRASEIKKVIEYRRKHLNSNSKGELDAKTSCFDDSPYMPTEQLKECFDDLKQKIKKNITADSAANAVSNMVLKQPRNLCHDEISTEEETLDSVAGDVDISNKGNPILFQGQRSLPRIYNLSSNPSSEDQNGDTWSDSFDLRAPKRQNVVKIKQSTIPRRSISDRPPAALPKNGKISTEDLSDYDDYTSININDLQMDTSLALETPTDDQYDYVTSWKSTPNTIPRQNNVPAMLTQAMELQSNEEYVITTNTDSTYLKVLSAEEDCVFTFIPDEDREKLK